MSTRHSTPDPTHSVRLFVAINLPEDEKRRLADAIGTLASYELPVRWVAADSLHITLKFLGDVAESHIASVQAALQRAIRSHRRFDVALEGLGAFPSLSRPNIFWIACRDADAVAEIQKDVEKQLEHIGFRPEARPYRAHVTIGRVKSGGSIRDRSLMDRMVAGFRYKAEFPVASADLMRSHLSPRGARYEVVARMELN